MLLFYEPVIVLSKLLNLCTQLVLTNNLLARNQYLFSCSPYLRISMFLVLLYVLGLATAMSTQLNLPHPVGTLQDGYVCNVPLPRVPQIQSASPTMSHEAIAPKAGIPIPGYLNVPSWIPTLPKLGSILRFSQRLI